MTGEPPPTDFTLGIDEPAVVAERARRAADFPALKIKVGGPSDLETLEAVRAVFAGPIRVDANTGWTPDGGGRAAARPRAAGRGAHRAAVPGPPAGPAARAPGALAAADRRGRERGHDRGPGRAGRRRRGVNVKLAKCGGLGPARRMLERARELGFRTFLGCMEETSIVIAASAAVAPLVDWADLDGCLLLADDPVTGLELGAGQALAAGRTGPASGSSCGSRRRDPDAGASTTSADAPRAVHRGLRAVDKSGGEHGGEAPTAPGLAA